ncbi:unnamed protein product [Psylliodes chrysocephalus]|uniref:Uncharacterized protein n=1 Tax=Psylliodes chrysocephalus TaxID=3402493 RepID=A0A9P0CZU7_9CUCU|nr:unnamed protein product [Psylliodes chrysocephala]
MAEKQKTFSLLPKILNGGIAGFIGVLCVFPLDLVKTRLQNQVIRPDGTKTYSSIVDALVKTFRKEGFLGMYKGSFVNLILVLPEKAIKLGANDMFRFHFKKADGSLPLYRQLMAGACTAVCQMIVTTPMELFKIQMQDQGRISAGASGPNTFQVVMGILKTDGIAGCYKGLNATMLRDIPFSMIYFPLFANLNEACPQQADGDAKPFCTFGAGLFAGGVAAITCTPCDVVKTRLQTIKKGDGEEIYTGIYDAFVKIYEKEGWKSFFKGGACRIMVIAPLFGVSQVVYYLGIAEYLLGMQKHT